MSRGGRQESSEYLRCILWGEAGAPNVRWGGMVSDSDEEMEIPMETMAAERSLFIVDGMDADDEFDERTVGKMVDGGIRARSRSMVTTPSTPRNSGRHTIRR